MTLKRILLCVLMLAALLLPLGSCAGQAVAWLDPKDGQTVWGVVRLAARVSGGAKRYQLPKGAG
jgi:hypothetical protein